MTIDNSKRYKRLHNWYYIFRDTAHPDKIETNFKLRQRVLEACLEDAINGVPLSLLVVKSLREGVSDVLDGYHNKLMTPLNIGRGSQGKNEVEEGMMGLAVSYVTLCKQGEFKRNNPVEFVRQQYGVSRASVQNWVKDPLFEKWKEKPFSFSSQEQAELNLQQTGEIFRNNKMARKKA